MRDVDRALADIVAIKSQLARQERISGYGPAALALTSLLAVAVGVVQAAWLGDQSPLAFLATWVGTAVLAAAIVGIEAVTRSRRAHSRLADAMIATAVEDFLPAGAAGALLFLVLARFEPQALWMLPGLWQMLVSLGLFAASRALPRALALVGAFYLVAGLAVLMLASRTHEMTPAMMGVPFAIGQLAFAAVIFRSTRPNHVES